MPNLTGKQLVELGIITGPITEENITQHGVDLNLIRVQKIVGIGTVPAVGKTVLAEKVDVELSSDNCWHLQPGAYDITLSQGCKVPKDKMLLIRQRSSLLRNGTVLSSSIFDSGFETTNIGTVMVVVNPIIIESDARVAQIYAHNSNEVENLYDGQFQNDKQRKS
jgi:deoxycytidine triphosphate deaminase